MRLFCIVTPRGNTWRIIYRDSRGTDTRAAQRARINQLRHAKHVTHRERETTRARVFEAVFGRQAVR